MAKSKLVKANEKIAEGMVSGYKKMEEGVVGGYKKIEEGVVGSFNKIIDKFVDNFLTREGETVEEARARLAAEQREREAAGKTAGAGKKPPQNIAGKSIQKAKEVTTAARKKAGLE